jgi:hypothetical protein
MGLTIHYRLSSQAENPKAALTMIRRLQHEAKSLPFKEVGEVVELAGDACDVENYETNKTLRWLLIQASQLVEHANGYYSVLPKRLFAFSTWPGEGCEPANFGLGIYPENIIIPLPGLNRRQTKRFPTSISGWSWASFCKTQYASKPAHGGVENFLRCHMSVVAMLDYAKTLGILKSVSDEGGYWDNRDVQALAAEVGDWNQMIARIARRLEATFGDTVASEISTYPNFEQLKPLLH